MQHPTDQDETSIPTDTTVINGPNMNRTVTVRRKAAKRSLPFDLKAEELHLVSPPPQDEDIPARKKPRLEEPLPTTADATARRNTASHDVSVGLSPPAADNDDENADLMTDTHSNAGATRATGRWTLEEDAKLTSAVANTSEKKWGKEYKTNWAAVAALVPGRTKSQCWKRWKEFLDPSIGRANGRTGTWEEDEDIKLKDAVEAYGGKKWGKIAALVPGRTISQCCSRRWNEKLVPTSIDKATTNNTS